MRYLTHYLFITHILCPTSIVYIVLFSYEVFCSISKSPRILDGKQIPFEANQLSEQEAFTYLEQRGSLREPKLDLGILSHLVCF